MKYMLRTEVCFKEDFRSVRFVLIMPMAFLVSCGGNRPVETCQKSMRPDVVAIKSMSINEMLLVIAAKKNEYESYCSISRSISLFENGMISEALDELNWYDKLYRNKNDQCDSFADQLRSMIIRVAK